MFIDYGTILQSACVGVHNESKKCPGYFQEIKEFFLTGLFSLVGCVCRIRQLQKGKTSSTRPLVSCVTYNA